MKSDEKQIYRFLLALDFVNRTLSGLFVVYLPYDDLGWRPKSKYQINLPNLVLYFYLNLYDCGKVSVVN